MLGHCSHDGSDLMIIYEEIELIESVCKRCLFFEIDDNRQSMCVSMIWIVISIENWLDVTYNYILWLSGKFNLYCLNLQFWPTLIRNEASCRTRGVCAEHIAFLECLSTSSHFLSGKTKNILPSKTPEYQNVIYVQF